MSTAGSPHKLLPFELVAPYYDELMESVPYRFWMKYLQTVWDHYTHRPQSVLDLACGTGTMSLLMAKQGLSVTGVDISAAMLAEARRKSAAAGIYVNYVEQDASELSVDAEFDTVVSLFDSLNNIVDPVKLADCFASVRRHMAPQSQFIFDLNTAYAFRQKMFDQKSVSSDGPLQYQWKSTFDEADQLCTVLMHFQYKTSHAPVQEFEEVHVQRAYSVDEIKLLLDQAGFDIVDSYDAYSLKPPKRRSDRVFFVARIN